MALGLGLGISFGRPLFALSLSPDVISFYNRVIADGGTFEAINCLQSFVNNLSSIDLYPVGDAVMSAFQIRVIADGGTLESFSCGAVIVQSLANIDIN